MSLGAPASKTKIPTITSANVKRKRLTDQDSVFRVKMPSNSDKEVAANVPADIDNVEERRKSQWLNNLEQGGSRDSNLKLKKRTSPIWAAWL